MKTLTHISLPFRPIFKQVLLSGVKTCTARTKYMGHAGDHFLAFGAEFAVLSVDEVYLYEVAALWRDEGCTSEEHFRKIWAEIHPIAGFEPYRRVKLHRFRLVDRE